MGASLSLIPGFCADGAGSPLPGIQADFNCENLIGYKAVYRVCFGMSMWFIWFSILMVNVKSSRDPRATIHNGFWFFKILGLLLVTAGSFYIPDGNFTYACFVVGSAGGFFFILIQVVLLVDFAHSWNESWMDKMEKNNSMVWYAALVLVTIMNYLLSFIAIVLFYIFYTKPDACSINKFFISFNVLLCFGASLISVLRKVQEYQPYSGLLQSSIITLYTTFLTWSAMSNEPDCPTRSQKMTTPCFGGGKKGRASGRGGMNRCGDKLDGSQKPSSPQLHFCSLFNLHFLFIVQ